MTLPAPQNSKYEVPARIIVQAGSSEEAIRIVQTLLASEPEFENSWVTYGGVRRYPEAVAHAS